MLTRAHHLTVRLFLDHAGCEALVTGTVHPEHGTRLESVKLDESGPEDCGACGLWGPATDPRDLHDADAEAAVNALEDEALEIESYRPEIEVA